jgi:hypothetical protein
MKIHKEFCPISISLKGQWSASIEPYCNCESFTHSGGSGVNERIEKPKEMIPLNIYKKFRCRGCYNDILIPIQQNGHPICLMCDTTSSTGTIKDLIDVLII